ncbi:MAG: Asp23/Gls24 family envelope stress response protein [Brevefilum sp.]
MSVNTIEKDVGKTTVSPDVLQKIAWLTTLSVKGVSRMAGIHGSLEKLLGKDEFKGVDVKLIDGMVFIEIYVVLMSDMNVRDISRKIQSRVSRAISEMVGMEVGGVTIHIMDIDFNA